MLARAIAAVVVAGALALGAVACAGEDVPTPSDPVLARGQQVYNGHCATCHGKAGGGGAGVKLAGVVASRLTMEQHIQIITQGQSGGMPAFAGKLSPEEIEAVARYEREAL